MYHPIDTIHGNIRQSESIGQQNKCGMWQTNNQYQAKW